MFKYQFRWDTVWGSFDFLMSGLQMTLIVSAATLVLAMIGGLIIALLDMSRFRALRWIGVSIGEVVRNTPFLVQLLLLYLGLPSLGLRLTPDQAALLAMVVNLGAYATEIVRAGIEAVPTGQIEAGRALGLRPHQIFRFVVVVPALRIVFPALGSQFILVMLASSVVSVISAEELTAVADTIIARNFRSFEFYFIVTGIYLALSLAFQAVFAAIDRLLFRRWSAHT